MACALSSSGLQCTLDEFELIDDDRLFIEQIFSLQAQEQQGEEYFDDEDLFMTFGCGGALDFQGYEGIAMDLCMEVQLPCNDQLSPEDQLHLISVGANAPSCNLSGAAEDQDCELAVGTEGELSPCYPSDAPTATPGDAEEGASGAPADSRAADIATPSAVEYGLEPEKPPEMAAGPDVRTDGNPKNQEKREGLIFNGRSSSREFRALRACQSPDRQRKASRSNSRCLHHQSRGSSTACRRAYTIDTNVRGSSCGDFEEAASSARYSRGENLKRRSDRVGSDITNLDSKRQDCGVWDHRKNGFHADAKENSRVRAELEGFIATPVVDLSYKYVLPSQKPVQPAKRPQETDSHRLGQRQKQIDFGKNTLGYERYLQDVPRHKRRKEDPGTPDAKQICSKRSWDGQIKKWRRLLHSYDSPELEDEELAEELC